MSLTPEIPFLTEGLPFTRTNPLDLSSIASNTYRYQLLSLADHLESLAFQGEIDGFGITFGMIRPATGLEIDNVALEEQVLGRIRGRFRVIGQLAVIFDQSHMDDFYQIEKTDLEQRSADPGQDEFGPTIWVAFSRIMTSGPTTTRLLLDEMAIEEKPAFRAWREFIGPTRASIAPKGTIRGDFGSAANNVVHGRG